MSWWSYRTTPLEALLRGRRRRIVKSSTTRLAVDVSDAKSLLGRRLGGLLFMLIGLGLAWLARRRERHHRRQALALESAAVSTIRDSQTVLRGQISDPLTGATQAGAPPMPTPIVAHAVPVAEAVPAMAVPVQTCPAGGHPLSSYSTQTVGHGCDVCGRQIAVAEQIWRCASCNYDKCSACAAVWAAPPQPSAPPAAAVPSGYDAMQQQQKQKQQQQQQQHPERPPPPDYATATAPPFSAVPQPQQQQVHAQQYGQPATAHAVPVSAAANPNIPMATAWAAPAAPIPTNGQTAPMFNPAWAGGAVDRVFVHLKGWIWAPDARLVRAPFTGEAVIAYHSRVTQEYQVLVKYTHRRKIKSGRRKGSKGKDDPGSDSEYEEEQRTRWENRTRTVWSDKNAVETLYIEDETGRVRFCPSKGGYPTPEENGSWAIGFGEGAFRDYQVDLPNSWRQAMADVAWSMLSTERTLGYRRTEKLVRRGMAFEGAGEMAIAEGALTLRKPTEEPGLLSLADVGQQGAGGRRGSDLASMPLVAELRHESTLGTSLVDKKKKGARVWVVLKWSGGGIAAVAGVLTAMMS